MARRAATTINTLRLVLISAMVALLSSTLHVAATRTVYNAGMISKEMERHEASSEGGDGHGTAVLLHSIAGRSSAIATAPPAAEEFSGRQVPTGSDPIHHHRAPISHSP